MTDFLTLWTIRFSTVCYVAALLTRRRSLWTAGLVLYLLHVAAAFTFHHHWSHAAAWQETARQTREMFGIDSGFGIWFNYAFTLVWMADATWWWRNAESYRRRARWITWAVHGFLAFMFFNGALVFGVFRYLLKH